MQQPVHKPQEVDAADAALRGLLSDVLGLPESRVAVFNGGTAFLSPAPATSRSSTR